MENLEDLFNVDNPPTVKNLSIVKEEVNLNSMKGITFTKSTRLPEKHQAEREKKRRD